MLTLMKLLDDRRSKSSVEVLVSRLATILRDVEAGRSIRDLLLPTAILLYLRWLDRYETRAINLAAGGDAGYQRSVPPTLRWSALAGLRGKALAHRIEEIFMPQALTSPDPSKRDDHLARELLQEVDLVRQGRFGVQIEQMARVWTFLTQVPGLVLDQLVELVETLPFETSEHLQFGEALLAEMIRQGATSRSAFAMPQVAADLMVEVARPKLRERIYDPCFGSGAVLATTARRLGTDALGELAAPDAEWQADSIFGWEHYPQFWFVGMVRITLAGVDHPSLSFGDVLSRPTLGKRSRDTFDCVMAVPPWRRLDKERSSASFEIATTSSEGQFLQHIASSLRPGGRAVVALPEAFLFSAGSEKRVRKLLMEEYHVEGIVGLPSNVFKPYTSTESALLVFRRAKAAEAVRFLRFESVQGVGRGRDVVSGATALEVARQFHERKSVADNVWAVPASTLASREWDLSPRRTGADELDAALDELQAIDDGVRILPLDKVAQVFSGVSYGRDDLTPPMQKMLLIGADEVVNLVRSREGQEGDESEEDDQAHIPDGVPRRNDGEDRPVSRGSRVTARTLLAVEHAEVESPPGGVPLVRAGDVNAEGSISPSGHLRPDSLNGRVRVEAIQPGDVLVTVGGTIGKIGLTGDALTGAVVARSVVSVRALPGVLDPKFLALLLHSDLFQRWMSGHARGSVIQNLSPRVLRALPIPVPPLALQERLVRAIPLQSNEGLTALKQVLLAKADSPLRQWLSQAGSALGVESMARAQRAAGSHLLAELEEWLHSLRLLRNEVVHGAGHSASDEVALVTEAVAAFDVLDGISNVPPGTARLSILQQSLNALESLVRRRGRAKSEAQNRFLEVVARAVPVLKDEIESILAHARVQVSLAKDAQVLPNDKALTLVVENASATPLRHFAISLSSADSAEIIPFFPDGARIEVSIPIVVGDVDRVDLSLMWLAERMDGLNISGEIPFSVGVSRAPPPEEPAMLDLGANPYITGLPVKRPEMFFGRSRLIDTIKRHLSTDAHRNVLLLEGNRRAGKSSILFQLERADVLPDWLVVRCDFQGAAGHATLPGIPTEQIFAFLAQRISEAGAASGLHFWPAGQRDWDGKKLFGPEFRRAFSAAMQVVPAFEAFKELLASVIDAIAPKRLLLMLDEFDRIQDGIDSGVTSSQVPQNIRFMLQNYPGVTAILTGSRRMTQMRSDYWSVLFGLGHRISVSSIDKNDAARLVTEPVKGRLIFPPQVVDRITEICAYQPFLIQRLCGQVFDLCASEASSVATVDILETAASILVDGMEHFEAFWGFAGSERARFILCVIHRLTRAVEAPPVTLPRIEDELARSGVAIRRDELVGDELKKLIELELVAMERDGYYRLAVPLLSIWISRNKDYEDQRERAARESGSG